jgi:hypothetical protein
MSQTLYVTFPNGNSAEKAAGALIDFGVRPQDVSVVIDHTDTYEETTHTENHNESARGGITTTTPRDVGVGVARGAEVGLGLGILAGLAALVVPGVGLVVGGGTLASVLGAAAATTAAGAVAGGVTGYLKDQGLPDEIVHRYANALDTGGALLAVTLPSGGVDIPTGQEIVAKYDGSDVRVY